MNFLPRTDLALEDYENEDKQEINEYDVKGINVKKITLDSTNAKKYQKKETLPKQSFLCLINMSQNLLHNGLCAPFKSGKRNAQTDGYAEIHPYPFPHPSPAFLRLEYVQFPGSNRPRGHRPAERAG
jgi:hypothetical protein